MVWVGGAGTASRPPYGMSVCPYVRGLPQTSMPKCSLTHLLSLVASPTSGPIVAVEVAAGPDLPGGLLRGGGGGAAGHRLHAAGVPAHPLHTPKVRLQMLYTSPHSQLFASGPLHQHPRAVHLVLVCKHCLRLKPHSRRQMQALVWESRSPPPVICSLLHCGSPGRLGSP